MHGRRQAYIVTRVNNDGHFIFRRAAKHCNTARAVDINSLKFGVEL
jgi:hypothetical protein